MSAAHDIEERAALWLMRREEPGWSPAEQAALDAWLGESMAHKAAYWRLEHGWREADRIAALGDGPKLVIGAERRSWRAWWRPVLIAASLLLAVGLGTFLVVSGPSGGGYGQSGARIRYATAIGARRVLMLPDGSRVELNTDTVVRSGVTPEQREFWLDRGEAYFEVAHAADHPFVVHAGSRTITVLGTRFSIRRDGDRVSVSVVEGRVRVDQVGTLREGGRASTTITGGDVALADGPSTLVTTNAAERVEHALSWRRGMLSFDQATLADAAAEFNRYNDRKLVVDDSETAAIRIGGTFQSSNIDAFVRLLHDAYGLRIEVRGDRTRISG